MRGSQCRAHDDKVYGGIIPAHAGLTKCYNHMLDAIGDHPRACGAHNNGSAKGNDILGSSPRMRGSLT